MAITVKLISQNQLRDQAASLRLFRPARQDTVPLPCL
jgi:hypothetical protein